MDKGNARFRQLLVSAAVIFLLARTALAAETPGTLLHADLLSEIPKEKILASDLELLLGKLVTDDVRRGIEHLGDAENAVRLYAVEYVTTGVGGRPSTASGLVQIPVAAGAHPWISYQQGTIFDPEDCPSNYPRGGEAVLMLHLFAAHGYVVSLPDYLGQGRSRVRHPYIHAATEATACMHLLEATRQLCARLEVDLSGKLFLTGFSQGGHATTALQRLLEENGGATSPVTASAPISGTYAMMPCWRWFVLQGDPFAPIIMAKLALSHQEIYGVCGSPKKVFLPPFDRTADELLFGHHTSAQVLNGISGDLGRIFRASFLRDMANGTHPLCRAFASNDVCGWRPKAPVRLYYGTRDMLVPVGVVNVAEERMRHLGADVVSVDVGAVSHVGTLMPSLLSAKEWFDSLR